MATIPIPSTSVSMDTIKQTLTEYGGSVSNDLLTFFTSGAKINPWSKWKPIIYPADFVDSEASMKAYNWGINVSGLTTTSVSEAFNGSTINEWRYTLPTGGARAPYRLGDFRKYRADATSPFREIGITSNEIVAGDSLTVTLYCRMFNTTNEDGMLGLNDIGDFDGCYVMFIKKSPSGTYSTVQSTAPISANHGSASAVFSNFTNASGDLGVHTIMAALYKNGVYYRLPISKKTVTQITFYANDFFESPYGSAYYNSSSGTGYVSFSQVIHAGSQTTEGPTFSRQLYIGVSPSNMVGPCAYGSVTIQKGQEGTLRMTFNQDSTSWASYSYILRDNDTIYIDSSSSGYNATAISVSK